MNIFLINGIIVLFILFLLYVLSMVWPPDSPWAPWWKIDKKRSKIAGKLAKITKNDVVYELGSGDGEFLLHIAKEFGARCIGIEIDPLRYWISVIRQKVYRLSGNILFVRRNFHDVSLSDATVIFVYLVPNALKRLKPKLLKELAPGTRIISYRYFMDFPLHAEDKKNQLYVYTVENSGNRTKPKRDG